MFHFGMAGGADRVLNIEGPERDLIALLGVTLRGRRERNMDGAGVLDTVLQLSSGAVVLLGTGDTDMDWRTPRSRPDAPRVVTGPRLTRQEGLAR